MYVFFVLTLMIWEAKAGMVTLSVRINCSIQVHRVLAGVGREPSSVGANSHGLQKYALRRFVTE